MIDSLVTMEGLRKMMTDSLITKEDWKNKLLQIRGVKSVTLIERSPSQGIFTITTQYKFWTYLWPGLNKKISRKVWKFIHENKPFAIRVQAS